MTHKILGKTLRFDRAARSRVPIIIAAWEPFLGARDLAAADRAAFLGGLIPNRARGAGPLTLSLSFGLTARAFLLAAFVNAFFAAGLTRVMGGTVLFLVSLRMGKMNPLPPSSIKPPSQLLEHTQN